MSKVDCVSYEHMREVLFEQSLPWC